MTTPSIRHAASADAPRIAEIYNHYVACSTATFDTRPGTLEARESWLAHRDPRHPVLVASTAADGVIGWGALSPYRERPAWSHTAEVALYIAPGHTGQGVGPALLGRLVEHARESGLHALVSQIVAENTASLAMTERAGFCRVGTLKEVGRKFDRWIDLELLQLVLDTPDAGRNE